MVLTLLKNIVYRLIVASGIVTYFIPYLLPKYLIDILENPKDLIVDRDGCTLPVEKYKGKIYPPVGLKRLSTYKDIEIRDDDVLICGYPKTGCHWVHEILTMLNARNLQLSKYGKIPCMLEMMPDYILDSLPSPRVLNTHHHYEDLPEQTREKKTKIIWTVRNPKDVVVSFYNHFQKTSPFYKGQFSSFFELFMSSEITFGSYFTHVQVWDKAIKEQANPILVVEFESMKINPFENVKKIAKFLEMDVSDDFLSQVVEACAFTNVKEKRSTSEFSVLYRKGVTGDWKNWLSEDQSKDIDKMAQEQFADCSYHPPT